MYYEIMDIDMHCMGDESRKTDMKYEDEVGPRPAPGTHPIRSDPQSRAGSGQE